MKNVLIRLRCYESELWTVTVHDRETFCYRLTLTAFKVCLEFKTTTL